MERALVKLNTNENPYPPSPAVCKALEGLDGDDLRLYPSPLGDRLREKAADFYGVEPSQVIVGNGSDEILAMILRACVQSGETVAWPVPTYSLYETLAQVAGARVISAPIAGTGSVQDSVLPGALFDSGARVVFVCRPNSPKGEVVDLAELARLCRCVDGLVVSDEAYIEFSDRESAVAILPDFPNLLVSRTLSKSFSLAGARVGFGLASSALVEELLKVKDSYNCSRLAQVAGCAAFDDHEWMRRNVERIKCTREETIARLRDRGWQVDDSQANFFWLHCGRRGGANVFRRLRDAGVLVRYFHTEALAEGVRISVGSNEEMARFLDALR